MSTLSEALGKPGSLTWRGKQYPVEQFDLNDIADMSDMLGDIENLDVLKPRHQILILWIIFRRLDESLTPDERKDCSYKMTLADAGKMVKAGEMNKPDTVRFLIDAVRLSGLYGEPATEAEPDEKNALGATGNDSITAS